jgi:hypothetical protein
MERERSKKGRVRDGTSWMRRYERELLMQVKTNLI